MTPKQILKENLYDWKDIAVFTLEDYLPAMLDVLIGEHAIGGLTEEEKEEVAEYVLKEFGKSINTSL